ncbi:MAG TPA: GNAT family N-acetyltransferase, partial [Ktedonobacterales bacterium]
FHRRVFRFVPLPHLCFIGSKRTDYLDFIIRPGAEQQFFAEFFTFLDADHSRGTFVELKDLRERSSNLLPLLRGAAAHFRVYGVETFEICVGIALAPSWEAFLGGLSSRTRRHVGYDRRALSKAFQVEMKLFTAENALDDGYRDLLALHRRRWQRQRGATHFEDERTAAFEREVAQRFAQAGWYRLYILYLNASPAAAVLGHLHNSTLYVDFVVHSPEFAKYSVGNVLLGMAIEDCTRLGTRYFDLLRGDERYKFHWGGQASRNFQLRLYRSRGQAAAVTVIDWLYQRAAGVNLLQVLRVRLLRLARSRASDATQPAVDAGP